MWRAGAAIFCIIMGRIFLQIKTKGFGGQMSKIMRNKFEPLVQKYKNNGEIVSSFAVMWAHSGAQPAYFSASVVCSVCLVICSTTLSHKKSLTYISEIVICVVLIKI
jgi:hypothetical protein